MAVKVAIDHFSTAFTMNVKFHRCQQNSYSKIEKCVNDKIMRKSFKFF